MANSSEPAVGSDSRRPESGVVSIHERMRFAVEFERWRVRTYMIKHNLHDRMYNPNEEWFEPPPSPRKEGDPAERVEESFMDTLPFDLVLNNLWPRVMETPTTEDLRKTRYPIQEEECSRVRNFGICCHVRRVCKGWKAYVEERPEWNLGLQAWMEGVHRIPWGETKRMYDTSDSDDSSGSEDSYHSGHELD